jgi:hypothetical protein
VPIQFVCQSPTCRTRCEFPVQPSQNPACVCGAPMKRVYSKPTLWELSSEEAASLWEKLDPPHELPKLSRRESR